MEKAEFDRLYREQFGKLVTSLVSWFGFSQVQLAEDLVQDTFLAAFEKWKTLPPKDPLAWLYKACKNRALNRIRNQATERKHISRFAPKTGSEAYRLEQLFLPDEIEDNQLRLLFACCNPAIRSQAQVILTLRLLGGLKSIEIARALGISEAAVKKSLTRTKQKIREKGISLKVPYVLQLKSRLDRVHKVIYLIFNEGYSATSGERLIKAELCYEAIRLAQQLIRLEKLPLSETYALLSMMLFHFARFPARLTEQGNIIELEKQDRSRWDAEMIQAGFTYLKKSRKGNVLSGYHLEAGIAAIHAGTEKWEQTDWCGILNLYDQLINLNPSAYIQLNRAIALYYCSGSQSALAYLQDPRLSKALAGYYLYHITLGRLYTEMGTPELAKVHFERGRSLTHIPSEQVFIQGLMDAE